MTHKHLTILFVLAVFAFFVSGCGKGGSKDRPTLPPPASSVAPTATPEKYPATIDFRISGAQAISHSISAKLDPANHMIDATDSIVFDGRGTYDNPIVCFVAKSIKILNVLDATSSKLLNYEEREIAEYNNYYKALIFAFPKSAPANPRAIINYFGEIYDPLRESGSLRFLVGDRTRGIISDEGIYLSGASAWYPNTNNSMATYRLEAVTPRSFDIITAGNLVKREKTDDSTISVYQNDLSADNLDVAGGVYSLSSKIVDEITVETFFHPDDAALAPAYLNAACKFITEYSKLLGKYPYNRFSIVSNFFPTGYGMPAFTLLGRQVIQRMHIQEYALGHEIVHNWWGNGVFVDWDSGNWCEGLTTYCSNYYWSEIVEGEDSASAAEYRRKNLQRYKVMVTKETDYPLRKFTSKMAEMDNEIGYNKASMFFHQIRLAIGKKAFFESLRKLRNDFLGRKASWVDLRQVFETVSGKNMKVLFSQWLDRTGLPKLALSDVALQTNDEKIIVSFTVTQTEPAWDINYEVVITTSTGTYKHMLHMNSASEKFTLTIDGGPSLISIDPDCHLLRDLYNGEVKPCLSKSLWFRPLKVYTSNNALEENSRFGMLAKKIADNRGTQVLGTDNFSFDSCKGENGIFIGKSDEMDKLCANNDQFHILPSEIIRRKLIALGKSTEEDLKDICYIVSMDKKDGGTATFFSWFGNDPAPHLDRIIFFYGYQGFVIFSGGRKLFEGSLSASDIPLEYRFKIEKKPVASAVIDISDGFDEAEMATVLRYLTSEELKGRLAGTDGSKKTAEYVASILNRAGIAPASSSGSYYQKFSIEIRGIESSIISWSALKDENGQEGVLPFSNSFPDTAALPLVFGGTGNVSRSAVYAGNGLVCPALGLNAYAKLSPENIRGKVFLIDALIPPSLYNNDDAVKYVNRRDLSLYGRAKAAIERGAAAVVFLSDRDKFMAEYYPSVTFSNFQCNLVKEKYFPADPVLLPADNRLTVASLQARNIEYGGNLSIPVCVAFQSMNFKEAVVLPESFIVSIDNKYTAENIESCNVIGSIPGSDPAKSPNAVILCAHFDHLGANASGKGYFPGANDNAAGVVTLLRAAADLKKTPQAQMVILLFCGAEEWGMRGSYSYLKDSVIPVTRTLAMLNVDMIGTGDGKSMYMIGSGQNVMLGEVISQTARSLDIELKGGIDHAIRGSDTWPFHLKGIPTVCLTTGRYRQYNTPADKPEIVSIASIVAAARLLAEASRRMAGMEMFPKPVDVYFPLPSHRPK